MCSCPRHERRNACPGRQAAAARRRGSSERDRLVVLTPRRSRGERPAFAHRCPAGPSGSIAFERVGRSGARGAAAPADQHLRVVNGSRLRAARVREHLREHRSRAAQRVRREQVSPRGADCRAPPAHRSAGGRGAAGQRPAFRAARARSFETSTNPGHSRSGAMRSATRRRDRAAGASARRARAAGRRPERLAGGENSLAGREHGRTAPPQGRSLRKAVGTSTTRTRYVPREPPGRFEPVKRNVPPRPGLDQHGSADRHPARRRATRAPSTSTLRGLARSQTTQRTYVPTRSPSSLSCASSSCSACKQLGEPVASPRGWAISPTPSTTVCTFGHATLVRRAPGHRSCRGSGAGRILRPDRRRTIPCWDADHRDGLAPQRVCGRTAGRPSSEARS